MMKILKTTAGTATLLMMASSSFGHPGHTTQLFHSHDGVTMSMAAVILAGVAGGCGYFIHQKRKQRRQADQPAHRNED
jgi:hypothetical protein